MDQAKMEHSIYPRVSVLKRVKGIAITKDQDKGLKSNKVQKEIKTKDVKWEIPKASCFLSIGKTTPKTLCAYNSKFNFDPFTPSCLIWYLIMILKKKGEYIIKSIIKYVLNWFVKTINHFFFYYW